MDSTNRQAGARGKALWVGFPVALLVAACAGHLVSIKLYSLSKGHAQGALLYGIGCFLVFALAYLLANGLRRRHRRLWHARLVAGLSDRWRGRLRMACIALAAFSLHGVALWAHDLLTHTAVAVVAAAAMFFAAIIAVELIEERLDVPQSEDPVETSAVVLPPPPPETSGPARTLRIEALALLVSRHEATLDLKAEDTTATFTRKNEPPVVVKLACTPDSLDADIKRLTDAGVVWNWQQLLRGIRSFHRHKPLKFVYLIGSEGERGSSLQLEEAEKLLSRYWGENQKPQFIRVKNVPFFNFRACADAIQHGVVEDLKSKRVDLGRAVFDATGGSKISSIAMVSCILRNDIQMQYVETGQEAKNGECRSLLFDPRVLAPLHT